MIETTMIKKCNARSITKDKDGNDVGGLCHLTGVKQTCSRYDAHNCEQHKAWKIRSDELKKQPAHVTSNWEKDQLFFTNRTEYFKRFGGK